MKKLTALIGLSLCAAFLLGTDTVFAAEADSVTTDGTIKFTPDTDPENKGDIHKPNEGEGDPEIIELPGEGAQGKGNLRIQFVPNFNFGTHEKIEAGAVTETVNLLKYNNKGETAKNDIAPFVQVSDERGKTGAAANWQLSVKASPFTANLGSGKTDILTNCEIRLNQSTLTMDYKDSSEAEKLVDGQNPAASSIKADGTQTIEVLKTKPDQSTNGYQISNVFDDSYIKNKTYSEEKIAGVQFYKPAGQAPLDNVDYKSILTWTLTTAP